MTETEPDGKPAQEWHADLLESAWGVIANAGWKDPGCVEQPKSPGWQEAAVRWRDDYFRWSRQHSSPGGYQSWEELADGLRRERDSLFSEVTQLRRKLHDAADALPVIPDEPAT